VSCYIAIIMQRHPDKVPEWEELAAVASGVQNLQLMAASLGVAGYWSSWQAVARDAPAMAEFMGMNGDSRLLGVYVCGMPEAGVGARSGTRQPWQSKVEWRV
jgi:hypothetical protein